MTVFVVLLRGVNVGGRKVPMADFRTLLQEIGCRNVRTYIQSGNAVIDSDESVGALVAAAIESAFPSRFGFAVVCVVITADDLATAYSDNPWRAEAGDLTKVHAGFLARQPDAEAVVALAAKPQGADRWRIVGRVFYLHAPDGLGKSLLAPFVERTLKVPVTFRNWRTVETLAAMASA